MATVAQPRRFRHELGEGSHGPSFDLVAGRGCRQQDRSLPVLTPNIAASFEGSMTEVPARAQFARPE
jgi:hypothetical protein